MPDNTSKNIGICGDAANHAIWRLKGSISADSYDAAGNLTHLNWPTVQPAEVASTSAFKAEPFLTEVITTSAPKPRAVRRTGCPLRIELSAQQVRYRCDPIDDAVLVSVSKRSTDYIPISPGPKVWHFDKLSTSDIGYLAGRPIAPSPRLSRLCALLFKTCSGSKMAVLIDRYPPR